MEIRELRYFLAVCSKESISKAAEALYVTQPNLSRQIRNLERECGQQLLIRGSRKITLTEAGLLLRKRAEEILELLEKTETELTAPDAELTGDVRIGGGESYAVQIVAKAARAVQTDYPNVRFHFFSGDTNDVTERLNKGLIDFGILIEPAELSEYDYLRLPLTDTWGVLMRKDSPLATKATVSPQELWDLPLIRSKHSMDKSIIADWFQKNPDQLHIVATYNLIYNASLLVAEGIGYAIGLDQLINTSGDSNLCFRPLSPRLESHLDIAWKKYQVFSKPAEIFLKYLKERL